MSEPGAKIIELSEKYFITAVFDGTLDQLFFGRSEKLAGITGLVCLSRSTLENFAP